MNKKYPPEDIEITEEEEHPKSGELLVPALPKEKSLVPVDPLTAYLNEIRKYEGLTEEEERELALKFRNEQDVHAAYRLVTSNLALVVRIAMSYKRQWENMMDLIQEGNVGLMKAVKNFDPMRGVRLSAYAPWWIKAYILKYILDNWRLVRVGTTNTRRKLLFNLNKEKEKLEKEGFVATTKLLAERFGVDEDEVIDVQASLGAADVSVDAPVHEDSPLTPLETLAHHAPSPEKEAETRQFQKTVRKKINAFKETAKPIERVILDTRILAAHPRSLKEIGDEFNITREAVRQAEQRLLKKFKEYILEELPEAADYFNT